MPDFAKGDKNLRIHLLSEHFNANCAWQSNVPESAVNHANMQIPLNGSAQKENCAFLKSNCWHEMQTAVNDKQNHDVSSYWSPIDQSNEVQSHDNRI